MRIRIVLVIAAAMVAAGCTPTPSPDTTTSVPSLAGTVDAPEFPVGLDWINTAEPLTLNDLRGKVVVLDFWTYGCINCIHVIPDFQRLETEFADELVVIGVHSAKFTNEAETANLVDIVQRYGIEHPVVNDRDFAIWDAWGANAWPTAAVIDPAGHAVGIRSGEGVYDALQPVIAALVEEFDRADAIDRTSPAFALEASGARTTALRYPGKVLAVDDRLFVADTGHHRVVEVDPDSGSAVAVWGSGSRGFTDGIGVAASFDQPHGLTIDDARTTLYVADTGNHAIRTVDLATGEVRTLAGTGELGWPPSPGTLDTVVLNSPWDVEYRDGIIYVANAGSHQIWAIDPDLDVAAPLIGSAREGTANGEFATAELAQPSGIEISETGELFFADAESSSIRVALLDGSVTELVVGGDATLFEFGDVDGTGNEARLQHPLGVALGDGVLYIADTYNSKIKRVDTEAGSVTSWLGGDPGWADGADPRFNEPGGLSYSDGILWVADTNNHAIRRIDATTGFTSTLVVTGVDALATTESYDGPVTRIEGRTTLAPGDGTLVLAYELPSGFKVNPDAPSSISVDGVALSLVGDGDLTGVALPARVPVTVVDDGTSPVTIDVNLIYCAENAESLCFIDRMRWELTVEVGNGSSELTLGRRIDG